MSIEKIKMILNETEQCRTWSLFLIQINEDKKQNTRYAARKIIIEPMGSLYALVQEIRNRNTKSKNALLNAFESVEDYDGTGMDSVIYRLRMDNELIQTQYQNLNDSMLHAETEESLKGFETKASVIRGELKNKVLLLISMNNPVTTLKNKKLANAGVFKEYTDKVLNLRTLLDVIIFEGLVYFLTPNGEKLFMLEQAYKASVPKIVKKILPERLDLPP